MRLIDADKLETHEIFDGEEWNVIVYKDDIDAQPTIESEPVRHGKWIYTKAYKDADFGFWICSCCKEPWWFQLNYCGNCGARMDVED